MHREGYHAAFWRNEDEMSFGIQHKDHGTADEHWGHKVHADEVSHFNETSSMREADFLRFSSSLLPFRHGPLSSTVSSNLLRKTQLLTTS